MTQEARRQHAEYLAPETLGQLAPFDLRAKMIVEGLRSGLHSSPYYGFSVEFAQHRQYVKGDDTRHLDWRVFGRSDKLYLKQYEQETNLDVALLVDCSGSMGYGSLDVPLSDGSGKRLWRKYDHATALCAAMSFVALQQQDRVGLLICADEVKAMVNRRSSKTHWRSIVSALSTEVVESETNLARCLDLALGKISNKVLFVIVSDLMDDFESLRKAMARVRHGGHDLILFHVLDRQEMRFDFRTPAPFEGFEDEGRLRIDPRSLRSGYLDALGEHCRSLERLARGFRFDYQRLDTHEPLGPALSHFLARRMSAGGRGRG